MSRTDEKTKTLQPKEVFCFMGFKLEKQYRCGPWDYRSPGFYFVTICTKQRKPFFGEIANGKMILSGIGEIVRQEWIKTFQIRKNLILDEWVIMPNHFHAIIVITKQNANFIRGNALFGSRNEAPPRSYDVERAAKRDAKSEYFSQISPKPNSVSAIIGSFKSIVTRRVHEKFPKSKFAWQPHFHDRIIRTPRELRIKRKYV